MNPPFKVVKNIIPKDHAKFLYEYQNIRYEATKYLYENKLVQPSPIHGTFDDDLKTPGAYLIYGDPAFDLLLMNLQKRVMSESGEDLMPVASYLRLYFKGHELVGTRKSGRGPENITAAIHLGHEGSENIWPFYIQSLEGETFKADLDVGDMVVYVGECKHWREPCEHDYYGQVMLHYIKDGTGEMLDGRTHLGVPKKSWMVQTS